MIVDIRVENRGSCVSIPIYFIQSLFLWVGDYASKHMDQDSRKHIKLIGLNINMEGIMGVDVAESHITHIQYDQPFSGSVTEIKNIKFWVNPLLKITKENVCQLVATAAALLEMEKLGPVVLDLGSYRHRAVTTFCESPENLTMRWLNTGAKYTFTGLREEA